MKWIQFGDSALISTVSEDTAPALCLAIEQSSVIGLKNVYSAYDKVLVEYEPIIFDLKTFLKRDWNIDSFEYQRKNFVIPVCYEMGEDLAGVCDELGLEKDEFCYLHSLKHYSCLAIGFCPGFPYLGKLDEKLCGLTRLSQPRKAVPPGSVAMVESQSAIYPLLRPGGWRLIGRTPLTIVDVEERYFPIGLGDRVKFEQIDDLEFERLKGERL